VLDEERISARGKIEEGDDPMKHATRKSPFAIAIATDSAAASSLCSSLVADRVGVDPMPWPRASHAKP
jgi:hypothetical protein